MAKVESILQDVTTPKTQHVITPMTPAEERLLIKRKDEVKITRENMREKLAEAYARDHETFEGEFLVHEFGKQAMDFRFKKWKQDDYDEFTLHHRMRYTLTRMLIRHINHGINYKKYKEVPGNPGIKAANASRDGRTVSKENMKLEILVPRCEFRVSGADPDDFDLHQPQISDPNLVNMYY